MIWWRRAKSGFTINPRPWFSFVKSIVSSRVNFFIYGMEMKMGKMYPLELCFHLGLAERNIRIKRESQQEDPNFRLISQCFFCVDQIIRYYFKKKDSRIHKFFYIFGLINLSS